MLSLTSPVVEKVEDSSDILIQHCNIVLDPHTASQRVEVEAEEIQDYQVVWARTGHWPWWPGVVTPGTRRLGKNLVRRVEFFGCDDKGRNTYSDLVSGARLVFIP